MGYIRRNMFTRLKIFLFLAGAAACFVICPSSTIAEDEGGEITIGLMAELSGTFAENGDNCSRGYRLARSIYAPENKAGNRRVRFVYADSQADAKVAVSEFKKLVTIERAIAVITTRSQIALALNPLSSETKVPLLATAGHPEFVRSNEFAFRFYPNVELEGRALAGRVREEGHGRVAVLTGEDQWMLALSEVFEQRIKQDKAEIVSSKTVLESEPDLRSVVLQLKNRAPDAVFLNLGIAQSGLALRRMFEINIKTPIYTTFWGASRQSLETAGKEAVEGMTFVEVDYQQPDFLTALEKVLGDKRASSVTFCCYAALSTVLNIISTHEDTKDKDGLYRALQEVKSLELLGSRIEIKNREAIFPLAFRKVENGAVK